MKRGIAFLSLLLFVAALAAVPAHASETPALQVFRQWLDAFNSGDAVRISAFWHKYGKGETEDRVSNDIRLHQMTGGMTIDSIVEQTDTHLVARMKENRGSWSESTMDLATTNPPIVAALMGHPIPPPNTSTNPAASDDDLAARVQNHVKTLKGPDQFSGAVLIAHDGKVLLDKAWGLADTAEDIANTPETQFCIGSMNKMFTAIAILQLVQQQKLTLDKPIITWWHDYPNKDLAARVTIRELLNHTGGTGDIFTPEYEAHRQETHSLADYVRLFGNRPVAFEPGTRWEYSNYGFILLGRIIEIVSGEPYPIYMREHIYRPAGMLYTYTGPKTNQVEGRAIGYTHGPNGLVPNTNMLPWSGTSAGGGYSTVHDLFLFAQALKSGKLLSQALLSEAVRGSTLRKDYGMGFYVLPDGGYGHGGGGPGINAEMHILPQRGYVLVALSNRDPRTATDMVDFMTSILPQSTTTSTAIAKP